jgi:hypothetical protein
MQLRAAAWLQALGDTLRSAEVPEAKADLIHAIYERIVVAGPVFVRAHLACGVCPRIGRIAA